MTRSKDDIAEELIREESGLEQLDRARDAARVRVQSLRSELATASSSPSSSIEASLSASAQVPRTPADKVLLFGSLFRGRPDVFPARFVSKKTRKAGYAPACANKWKPGICALGSGGRCGECVNQAFVRVSDQAILDHLQGRHVMGVYPLLDNETCWFLAADFDKRSWQEDTAAFAETCQSLGVSAAIERSRSGNGAHAWFFFTAPVPANAARRMGCYLITETMSRRHELSMNSYDRLFPNQDTTPRGGFGNLIALPLQHEPRQQGNSVFVDDAFEPFPDQWAFLANVPRIDSGVVEAIAREAARIGQVVGVRSTDAIDDDEAAAPWTRPPSGQASPKAVTGPLPPVVKAVLAQQLFVEKTGLPPVLLNQLKRLAAFQNPEFYKKQKMRLSTALTPRVITCAEELPLYVVLPRALRSEAERLFGKHGITLAIEDQRYDGKRLRFSFTGELTPLQKEAARALLSHDTGVFVGPPGIGKTVLGTYLVAQRARSALILVHRKPLLEQWIAQLSMFLGIDQKQVGQIGGGRREPNGWLDVATIQSLVRRGTVDDLAARYAHVIIDECHHLPAASFERVISEVKARFIVGLTATPQRRDGLHPISEMQLGPVRYKIDARNQATRRPFEHKLIVRETSFRLASDKADVGVHEIYRALVGDKARNTRIVDDVIAALEEGRSPILLTERKDHLEYFAKHLGRIVRHLVVLRGGMSTKKRRGSFEQLASIPDEAERLILATGRYLGEGFDDARLDTLFLAMPISWKGTLIQYSGRLHRYHPAKTEVRIYDYVDCEVPMLLRMFEKRLRTYRAIGYARGEAPLGFAGPTAERTVEYDEDTLRQIDADF